MSSKCSKPRNCLRAAKFHRRFQSIPQSSKLRSSAWRRSTQNLPAFQKNNMQAKHVITEPWRGYLQKVQAALRVDAEQILLLRGRIAEIEMSQQTRRMHANAILDLIRIEAKLPETMNTLSDDGCFLIGEMTPAKEE